MEDELVQNILSQSTYDAAYRRAQNKRNWTNTNNFQYKTGVSDLLSQVRDTRNGANNFFSSLSGTQVEMPSVESSMERARQSWALRDATKRAEERLEKEKEAATYPTFSTSYDVTRGWRESTEDAARLDKYIAEELGASPEEAQQVYNDTWNNSNKTLGIATAATLGTAATFGAAGSAFGPVVADITNGLFAVDAAKNLASGEGIQKTFRLARQGDWKGALKSGAWDALDLSMLGHTAGLVGRVGKSVLSGRSLGNAYRSDIAGRLLKQASFNPAVTRVGDVELTPGTYYRQGNGLVKDLQETGTVRANSEAAEELGNVKIGNDVVTLLRKDFSEPMFAKGKFWYEPGAYSDLLVTNEGMNLANKNARITSNLSQAGVRRIPHEDFPLTAGNVTGYRWDPNYGYRYVSGPRSWQSAEHTTEFIPSGISPQEAATTYHFDGVIPGSRPISIAEKSGVPKAIRNIRTHGTPVGPYYDYSLINRSYEPWVIDEIGRFVFESPEKAKKLSSIHFSLNEPVRSHTMGSWDDAPITTLLPYRNIRSKTAPVDIAIMDTFFPNYSGLKISSRGSKTLTGDKAVYDLYKSKGLDVELNPELESLLNELKAVRGRLDKFPTSERYSADASSMSDDLKQLFRRESEITDRIDAINREWTKANAKVIPSYDKLMEFGKSEGLPVEEFPYMLGTPKKDAHGFFLPEFKGFNYDWVSDPSNHAAILQDPTSLLNSINRGEYKVTPEYKKFVEWVVKNKVDYRKQGGILKAQEGRIIKSISNAAKTKKVELTGDLFAGMEAPKSINMKPIKLGVQKEFVVNPDAFSGIENLTSQHIGFNNQVPMLKVKEITLPEAPVQTGRSAAQKHESFMKGLNTYSMNTYRIPYKNLKPEYKVSVEKEYRGKFKK